MTIDKKVIEDIFNIVPGKNISDDDETDDYGGEKVSSQSFDEKAVEVSKSIERVLKVENIKVDNNPIETVSSVGTNEFDAVKTTKKTVVEDRKTVSTDDHFLDAIDKLEEKPKVSKKNTVPVASVAPVIESIEKHIEEVKKAVDETVEKSKKPDLNIPVISLNLQNNNKKAHRWNLNPPSEEFNSFYAAKKEALENDLLIGGEIDPEPIMLELENASVDVSVGETFVADLVSQNLQNVQKLRERIKSLQLRINRQYFFWERAMELFEGLLKKTMYIRGKQDGLQYEHMYDMEMYFSKLKMLHKSIDSVSKALDGAFECLSRQITIVMPMKEVDRYNNGPKPMTPQLKSYDSLKTPNSSSSIRVANTNEAKTSTAIKEDGWSSI
jgi:hypothetical protein